MNDPFCCHTTELIFLLLDEVYKDVDALREEILGLVGRVGPVDSSSLLSLHHRPSGIVPPSLVLRPTLLYSVDDHYYLLTTHCRRTQVGPRPRGPTSPGLRPPSFTFARFWFSFITRRRRPHNLSLHVHDKGSTAYKVERGVSRKSRGLTLESL